MNKTCLQGDPVLRYTEHQEGFPGGNRAHMKDDRRSVAHAKPSGEGLNWRAMKDEHDGEESVSPPGEGNLQWLHAADAALTPAYTHACTHRPARPPPGGSKSRLRRANAWIHTAPGELTFLIRYHGSD